MKLPPSLKLQDLLDLKGIIITIDTLCRRQRKIRYIQFKDLDLFERLMQVPNTPFSNSSADNPLRCFPESR